MSDVTCDLLDLDVADNDAGTLSIDHVNIDSRAHPPLGFSNSVPALSFGPGMTGFSGWTSGKKPRAGGTSNDAGLAVSNSASGIPVTVTSDCEYFEAFSVSPPTALMAERYYRATFMLTATDVGSSDFEPTVRAGIASSKFVYSAHQKLKDGGQRAAVGWAPTEFEAWMRAPSADPVTPSMTEPMSLRIQSYLTTNNTGWPFNANVSGTLGCTEVRVEEFGTEGP